MKQGLDSFCQSACDGTAVRVFTLTFVNDTLYSTSSLLQTIKSIQYCSEHILEDAFQRTRSSISSVSFLGLGAQTCLDFCLYVLPDGISIRQWCHGQHELSISNHRRRDHLSSLPSESLSCESSSGFSHYKGLICTTMGRKAGALLEPRATGK